MASLTHAANGTYRVLLPLGGKRRTLRLGKLPANDAEAVRLHVEQLALHREHGATIPPATLAWLRSLPERPYAKLARLGLVEARSVLTLGELLTRYERTATVKKSTADARRQTTGSLRQHFGDGTPIDKLTPAGADGWRRSLADSGLAVATQAKRTIVAKAIFARAVRWGLLAESPFADLKTGSQANPARMHYVDRETIAAVLDACPDAQWRTIIALCRYAGLRCPSEIVGLTWADVNWERGRLTVRSPKTAGHEGHAVRVVPIIPKLRPILLALFTAAEPGVEAVVPRLHDPRMNLRTTFDKIVTRAGVQPWPKPLHNLRASCAMDWAERFPAHVAASWLGHSPLIAARHYLQTRDAHFDLAVGAPAAHNAAHSKRAGDCTTMQDALATSQKPRELHDPATSCTSTHSTSMGDTGLEPVTSCMSSTRSSQLS